MIKRLHFSHGLKFLKYFAISLSALIFLVIGIGVIIAFFYEDEVARVALNELNKYLKSEVAVKEVHLSLIRKFPNASLQFEDVVAKSTREFNRRSFGKVNTDTLFKARNLFLEFNVWNIIDKHYKIKNIHLDNGNLNLFIDKAGHDNFHILKPVGQNKTSNFQLALRNVKLTDVNFQLYNLGTNVHLLASIKHSRLKGDFFRSDFKLTEEGLFRLQKLIIGKFQYLNRPEIKLSFQFDVAGKKYRIKKGKFILDGMKFFVDGGFMLGKQKSIDLNVEGLNLDIDRFIANLPQQFSAPLRQYEGSGNLIFNSHISGSLASGHQPHIIASFEISDGKFQKKDSRLKLTNLKVLGIYSNGVRNDFESSTIELKNFSSQLGESQVSGKLKVVNFNNPYFTIDASSHIVASDLLNYLPLDTLEKADGTIDAKLKISGKPKSYAQISRNDILNALIQGETVFHDVSLKVKGNPYTISGISGKLLANHDVKLDNLTCNIAGNDFTINGQAINLIPFLLDNGKKQTVTVDGDIYSRYLDVNRYLTTTKQGKQLNVPAKILFPENVLLDLNFRVDNFTYNHFKGNYIKGKLNYHPTFFTLRSVSLHSVDGKMSGGGAIIQTYDKNFIIQCQAKLDDIDIRKLFYSFNNFGQKFLLDHNLKGTISGDFDFSSEWTKNMRIIPEKIVGQGSFNIQNGELIQFEPMLGLSRFIALSELRDVKFSTLKNEIYIKDSKVIIPQMDINSSAINLTGSGIHGFDGKYSYKVKLALSQVLWRKTKHPKNQESEFGPVEDDGLGNTSVYLSIDGTPGNCKVRYDTKMAKDVLIQHIKSEKKVLKGVLHDEFGWFKKDTTLTKGENEKVSKKPFRVQWDDEQEKQSNSNQNKTIKKNRQRFNIQWDDK